MMYCLNSKQLCSHSVSPLPNLSLGSSLSWFWNNVFDNEFRTYIKHKIHLKASSVKYHISLLLDIHVHMHQFHWKQDIVHMCLSEWNDFQDFVILKRHQARLSFIPFLLHWNVRHSKVDERYNTDPYWQSASTRKCRKRSFSADIFLYLDSLILSCIKFCMNRTWKKLTALFWNRQKVCLLQMLSVRK